MSVGPSVEDYLKRILELSQVKGTATTSDLSEVLSLSAATVSVMLKRLKLMNLVHYQPYQGCSLTDEGRRIALKLLRSHRILECFLIAYLGYTWEDVDAEAERLEHALSDRVVNRMEEMLGFPKRDPHGAPIPDRDLHYDFVLLTPLVKAPAGRSFVIEQVSSREPAALKSLRAFGLGPGTACRLLDVTRETLHLEIAGRPRTIPAHLASSLLVRA